MSIFASITLAVVGLSQISSYLINTHIPIGKTVVINSLLHFTHVRNLGGIFGSFQGYGWVFAIFTLSIIIGLTIYLWKGKDTQNYEYICLGLIAGGGSSNLVDRLIYGSVIDFINVQHIPYWKYVFNTADTMIHLGLWPLLILSLTEAHAQSSQESSKEPTPTDS